MLVERIFHKQMPIRWSLPAAIFLVLVIAIVPVRSSAKNSSGVTRGIQVLPKSIQLTGREAIQRLIVVESSGSPEGLPAGLVADELTWESSDPKVAIVEGGYLRPLQDGTTDITVTTADGRSASASVLVEKTGQEHQWSFRNDVESIFARLGCSMGACHGALAGKGGFRLSLRGYDPMMDWETVTREARGRRVELNAPARSLLLTKPTGALPHKGGIRLNTDSREYRILSEWIASGAPAPSEVDPALRSIEVTPSDSMLTIGDSSQILVTAKYEDGRSVDVTHWAKYSATDESIAGVDENGRVSVRGSGQGAILVWFGSKVALARITVPYEHTVDADIFTSAPRSSFIDDLVLDQLQTLNLKPSPRCSDEAFVRRATIDTIGRLPTAEETREFLASEVENKRDSYIDSLLESEEFIDYWTYKWSDLLLVNGQRLRPDAVKAYYQWIRENVERNEPWDSMVRQILTATGSSLENGATNFYALHQDPENLTENAAQAFLGLSIGCAKCHNHPLEKWTNDQYYAMANLFARVRGKGWGGDSRNGDGKRTIYVAEQGDLIQPGKGKPQPPAPLDAEPLEMDDPSDRRVVLADWMVSPDNPYFSRAITNRVWKNYFGVALVEETDDLRLSNPASNERLLDAAAEFLADQDFDLKSLMREILRSETYQRSSQPLPENVAEHRYYSRYYPRRLMAEVLLDSIDQSLGTHSTFDTVEFPGADVNKTDFYPTGTRAIELYDSAVQSYFLKTFGRNSREITCECQRSDEPSMVQILHLSNGKTLNGKLAKEDNRISQWMDQELSYEEVIHEFFLVALSREPTTAEQEKLIKVMSDYGPEERRIALEDFCWSVLTSSEFIFNQ